MIEEYHIDTSIVNDWNEKFLRVGPICRHRPKLLTLKALRRNCGELRRFNGLRFVIQPARTGVICRACGAAEIPVGRKRACVKSGIQRILAGLFLVELVVLVTSHFALSHDLFVFSVARFDSGERVVADSRDSHRKTPLFRFRRRLRA
jgi:hypothetical protein